MKSKAKKELEEIKAKITAALNQKNRLTDKYTVQYFEKKLEKSQRVNFPN